MSHIDPRRMSVRLATLALVALAGVLILAPFASAAGATFSDWVPAPGSGTTNTLPRISVRVMDDAGIRGNDGSLWFRVDGKSARSISVVYDRNPDGTYDYTKATISATPRSVLANGPHNVEVSIMDWAGGRYTTSWSFRIGITPALDSPQPAPNSTVRTTLPVVSARVAAGAYGIVPAVLVDGTPVIAAYDPVTKLVSASLTEPIANDEVHDVLITVTNGDMLSTSLAWSFYVLTEPRMPDTTGGQCSTCHPTYPAAHPMTNCSACHGYDGPVGGFYTNPPDYHPEGEAAQFLGDCASCHSGGFPTVPMHEAAVEVYHSAGTGADSCKPCHVSDLLAEHYYREETNDCMVCHGSADSQVQAAIGAGDTGCYACHDGNHGGSHDSDIASQVLSGSYAPDASYGPYSCTGCHEVGLVGEHVKGTSSSAPDGCDNCHPSPRNTLTPDWNLGCVQGGCHPAASASSQHGLMAIAHLPLPENASCVGCHDENDLGYLHVNAVSGTDSSCFICHAGGQVPEVKNCVTCHPDRVDPHGYEPALHESGVAMYSISGSYPSGSYGPVTCDVCHFTELGPEHQRTSSSSAIAGCDNCHPSPRNTLTPSWSKGCEQGGCHPAGSPTAEHSAMTAAHAVPPEDAACEGSGCHDEGDLGAIHIDAPTQCAACHSTTSVPSTKICTDCHGTPHGDLAAAHTANEPGGMFWANTGAYAPCIQCHYLDVRTEHAKASSGSLGCSACHYAGAPVTSPPSGDWTGQCAACHTSIHPNYDGEHVAYGQDCTGCHGDPEDARDFHRSCGATPGGGWTPNPETLPCHIGPDYVPYPQLGPPYTNGYWCRTCHPEE